MKEKIYILLIMLVGIIESSFSQENIDLFYLGWTI